MTAWYDKATFYHMYPLGMTGSPFANPYPVSDGAAMAQTGTFPPIPAWTTDAVDSLFRESAYFRNLYRTAV